MLAETSSFKSNLLVNFERYKIYILFILKRNVNRKIYSGMSSQEKTVRGRERETEEVRGNEGKTEKREVFINNSLMTYSCFT